MLYYMFSDVYKRSCITLIYGLKIHDNILYKYTETQWLGII